MKEDAKIKVLQVTSGFRKGISGGIPSSISNLTTASTFDDNEIGFDFLTLGYQTFEPYREELEKRGATLYNLDIHSKGIKAYYDILRKLSAFIKKGKYDIIHINSGALIQLLVCSMASKMAGLDKVIIHTHSTLSMTKQGVKKLFYSLLKPFFKISVNRYFACSEMAANCVFPNSVVKSGGWTLINNSIPIDKYLYNEKIRNQYREIYGLKNKFVLGHIGRLVRSKNHLFLIDILHSLIKIRPEAVLLLVGEGEMRAEIEEKTREMGLEDKVLMVGQRKDANNFLQAMDVFLFPSEFEGLGMVVVEAQASGLRVFASNTIPIKETKITDAIDYLPLHEDTLWIQEIAKVNLDYKRESKKEELVKAGYELETTSSRLKRIYSEMMEP